MATEVNPNSESGPTTLKPAEMERLALLAEECGEVIQVIGKILRHGFESYHPADPVVSNRMLLEKELGDLQAAITIAVSSGDVRSEEIADAKSDKFKRVVQYLHHQ